MRVKGRGHIWSRLGLVLAAILFSMSFAKAHLEEEAPRVDLLELCDEADFVFVGEVTAVTYRNSEKVALTSATGAAVFDEKGEPQYQDGSDLPHAFVTYAIESILKGRKSGDSSSITLRFIGGRHPQDEFVEEDGERVAAAKILCAVNDPLFDVGDRDMLFVQGNGERSCPLVNAEQGRLRLLNRDRAKQGANHVYTETGAEIRLVTEETQGLGCRAPVQTLAEGRSFDLEDVMHNDVGGVDFGRSAFLGDGNGEDSPGEGEADADTPPGEPLMESDLMPVVERAITEVNTREELANLPPVADADPAIPFTVAPATDVVPPAEPAPLPEPDRPWLDELTPAQREAIRLQEADEAAQFELSGGDPTLTPIIPQR